MEDEKKKPIYKKWWFWVIIAIIILSCVFYDDTETQENTENNIIENTAVENENIVEENTIEETNTVNETSDTTTSDLNEKETNLRSILRTLYPYGFSLPLLEGFQYINSTDTYSVYGGTIEIENAYGNESSHTYTVRYDTNNNVEQIVVDGESVYGDSLLDNN